MLTTDEARALITTSLSDADLADVIEREEAWLARRVGPLDGERVETFVAEAGTETLELQRPASTVEVTDGYGDRTADVTVRGWADAVLTEGVWSGEVEVVYTPADEPEVKRAVLTLVRLAVAESAFASESSQGYSATTDITAQRTARWAAWHGLLRPRKPTTTRLRSTTASDPEGIRAVSVVAVAS